MSQVTITREDGPSKARYVARVEGHDEVAELTLSKVSSKMIIADHTGVPDALRGTGVGLALVERLIADAREAGQLIVPLCPFVRAQALKRRAEWQDVVQF